MAHVGAHRRRAGFTDFDARPRRLRLLLDAYGYSGPVRPVLETVRTRIAAHAQDVRDLAADGDPFFARLLNAGTVDALDQAITELDDNQPLWTLDQWPNPRTDDTVLIDKDAPND